MTIIVKKLDKTLFCDSYNNYIRNTFLKFRKNEFQRLTITEKG